MQACTTFNWIWADLDQNCCLLRFCIIILCYNSHYVYYKYPVITVQQMFSHLYKYFTLVVQINHKLSQLYCTEPLLVYFPSERLP
jgi:hypothetical protein